MLRDDIPHIHCPNTWGLPGGLIEPGETAIEGCNRELLEEINVVPANMEHLFSVNKTLPDRIHLFNLYKSYFTESEVAMIKLGDEGQELKFFEWHEISHLPLESELGFFMGLVGEYLNDVLFNMNSDRPGLPLKLLGDQYFSA